MENTWCVIDDLTPFGGADCFITPCDSREAAVDEAVKQWAHLTLSEQARRNIIAGEYCEETGEVYGVAWDSAKA